MDCTNPIITEHQAMRARRINHILFSVWLVFIISLVTFGCVYNAQHTFSPDRWERLPDMRTRIVDDLLRRYDPIGMTEAQVLTLLGDHDNDYGYFAADDRYVYHLGPERGLISIDSEWLILDFTDGVVTYCYLTTD